MPEKNARRAVFLDRDGTVFEDMEFSTDPGKVRALPGALDGMRRLQDAGYRLIIITNQSGVARGYFDEASLQAVHDYMVAWLRERGIDIEAVYYCPHYAGGKVAKYAVDCQCRKPKPGMLLRAAREHGIDLKQSWMIGDRPADVGAGRAAGCRTIRVLTGPPPADGDPQPDGLAENLAVAAGLVLGEEEPAAG